MILGIVGDSAAGKTTLTSGIAAILGPERVACICSDDYHRYGRAERAALRLTALDPACNYLDIFEQHLRLLRQGQPILKPVYDHRDGTLAAPEYVEPRPYIIVEGLLGYHSRAHARLLRRQAVPGAGRGAAGALEDAARHRQARLHAASRSCSRSASASTTPRPTSARSGPSPTSW